MNVLRQYLLRKGFSEEQIRQSQEEIRFVFPPNRVSYFIDDEMLFSHRGTQHAQRVTDIDLHTHGHYELFIHVHGDVEYIQNDRRIHPKPYTVMWCKPGAMHAFRPLGREYELYMLYFSPRFFSHNGKLSPMLQFTEGRASFAFHTEGTHSHTLEALLKKIEDTLQADIPYKRILAKALIIELFAVFNTADTHQFESESLTDRMAEVKQYIDRNYADISNIDQIANVFYYSREHLSRKFRARFNISISEYLSRRRVTESIPLLLHGSAASACYAVGFRSQSVYISAFKKNIVCLPSEYKKQFLKDSGSSPP